MGRKRRRLLAALTKSHGLERRVVFTGYVDDSLAPAIYRQSRLHVYPSRYEGFGLPVLEAIACGSPTITSTGSSLDEVSGDAAIAVPCGDVDTLQSAMDRLFFDDAERSKLRARAIARAHEFTWRRCAEATLAFWRRSLEA